MTPIAAAPASFLATLLADHQQWRDLPLIVRSGMGWHGLSLTIPSPQGSDVTSGLDIEEVGDEITVSFDHAHLHLAWPPHAERADDPIWLDARMLIHAILGDDVVASSGWINGELRTGSLHRANHPANLMVPGIQRIRTRSWSGTFNRDEIL